MGKKGQLPTSWQARFDSLQNWHSQRIASVFSAPLPMGRAFILVAVLAALFAAIANYQVRQEQYQIWQDNRQVTFLDETPLFSTTDASFFVGLAKQYNETGDQNDFQARRLYPFYANQLDDVPAKDGMRDFPLLSVLIASLSPDNSTESLMKTANALIPVLAFVMALGVLFAFGAAGFWLEGAVAAIGAGFAPTFMMRSAIGRIDTDILNLGFFYAVLGLTIFAGRAQSLRAAIIWTVAAALMMNLFFWWYDKAFMAWGFTIGLVWLSFMTSRNWQRPLIVGGLFIVLSGLIFRDLGISTDSEYLIDVAVSGALIFPNTFSTITELRVVPFEDILKGITSSVVIGTLGVIGMAFFAVRHPVIAVVFGPASIFALANFLVGNRAIFYSAPMLWFGVAFLAVAIIRYGWRFAPEKIKQIPQAELLGIAAVITALMIGISQQKDIRSYVPNPSFPKDMMRGFAAMQGNLPDEAVVATWWDYGYASMLFNGYRTLHDGGAQTTPVTHYFARALVSHDQSETHALISNLAKHGLGGIQDNSDAAAKVEALLTAPKKGNEGPPVFLVLTDQMAGWIGSISKLGLWDPSKGQPINVPGNRYGPRLAYQTLQCRGGEAAHQAICNGQVVDFNLGTIDNQPLLSRLVQTTDGKLVEGQNYPGKGGTTLMLAEIKDKGVMVKAMHNHLAQSSFHKLFHLADVNQDYFSLVYDDYPNVRIYALR